MKSFFTPDRTIKIVIFGLGAALLILLLRDHRERQPNVCPIDGHAAQWTKRQNGTACQYGHFSDIEKTVHTWTAPCS
jgi:hypothetical protein